MSENVTASVTPMRELIAEEVRALLGRRKLNASELARRLGVSQPYISRRLTGDTAFDVDDLEKIAQILNVEVADLFPREGRTVVVAGEAKRSTTVAKHTAPHRPHPTSQARRQAHIEATRRPVRISLLHA